MPYRDWSFARLALGVFPFLWAQPAAAAEPVSFNAEVVPALTKAGCNVGGCHGKAEGQNGFKLSLFGFESADDYEYVVKEARGRCVFAAAPAQSLLLLKGTGTVPHAGGKRLDPKSDAYDLLRRWVAEGTRPSFASEPGLDRIEVRPGSAVLGRGGKAQVTVVAHLRDGTTRDVTKLTVLEAGPPDVLAVDANGVVTTKQKSGSATVTARYRDAVAVARVTVPFGTPVTTLPSARTVITNSSSNN